MSPSDRVDLAARLLQEVVFASRARQAAGVSLASRPAGPDGAAGGSGASGTCGLGARAEVELDLSPAGQTLARQLWPTPLPGPDLERARRLLADWVERQDAFDRKRNHFLRDFRGRHGFDRGAYAPQVLAAFDAGLGRINAEASAAQRAAAEELQGL